MPQTKESKQVKPVGGDEKDAVLKSIFKPEQAAGEAKSTTPLPEIVKKPERAWGKIVLGIVVGLLVVIVLGLIILGVGLYKFNWQNDVVKKTAKFFGYPAVLMNYHGLSYADYADDIATLNHFYTAQEEQNPGTTQKPSDAYIKKSVLSRMVREKFLENQLKAFGLGVTQEEIDTEYSTIVSQAGSEATVSETLTTLYNWTPSQFKEKVLRPYVIRSKVQEHVAKDDTVNAAAKSKAEEALAKLKGGSTFEDVAKEYSEDTTASTGGDLGYFGKGEMVTEFEDAAFALKAGETSGIVKTQYGYHIIKLTERIAATADKAEQLRASHILIKAKDLDTWINEELAKDKVTVLIGGLSWKKDCGLVLGKAETCDDNELTNTTTGSTSTNTNTNSNTNTNTESTNTNTTANTNTAQQ